jgi:hypothetical protein
MVLSVTRVLVRYFEVGMTSKLSFFFLFFLLKEALS